MDHALLEALLRDLTAEIALLEAQLAPLQSSHDALYRKVTRFENENKHKNLAKPLLPKIPQPPSDDPPLVHFSYFDDSIHHYFAPDGSGTTVDSKSGDEKVLHHIDAKTSGAKFALQELTWRLGGISAFPINNRLYDDSSDALLGVRFDILSHFTHQFVLPHYIILRRRQHKSSADELKWLVFRYTTPSYLPLATFTHFLLEDNLYDFVQSVRECLVYTQYKHDKFLLVSGMTYGDVFGDGSTSKLVSSIEKDLECRRVVLHFENHSATTKQLHTVELDCGGSAIQKVNCNLAGGSPGDNLFVESLLANCSFSKITSSLGIVARYLRNHGLL